jgi:UDP-glucuronate decarboxylase
MTEHKHYLLTGGTGFFGVSLLRHLRIVEGDRPRLTVLSRDPERFCKRYPNLVDLADWIRGDVLDYNSLPTDQRFTHVIHAAADSTFGPKLTPLERYDQIVTGTKNVLDLAIAVSAKRFLLTSSGGVYGPQPSGMALIPEDYCGIPDPLSPTNAYGVAKRTAEHLCALYQNEHGIETTIARCFAFVGQDLPLDAHFAIGNFIRDALWRDEITVSGDGGAVRSYLDQSDLAVWLLAILEKGKPGRAYNVGSDRPISIAELAHLVRDTLAPNKELRILGKPSSSDMGRSLYVPDINRAQEELGLNVNVKLEDAVLQTAKSYQ